jgi:hypothetical protein
VKRDTAPYKDDELNEAERLLIACAAKGEIAVVKHLDDRTIRADVIRELAIESWHGWPVHEHGVRVEGAEIRDTLDLQNCHVQKPLRLIDCDIGDGSDFAINAERASLATVNLNNSRMKGGIYAQAVEVRGGWFMNGAAISDTFNINSAKIDGQVSANGATFSVDSGNAINAHNMSCRGWFMDKAKISGTFNIHSAKIDGPVVAIGAIFSVDSGDAINAQAVSCRGWFMNEAKVSGTFNIHSAKIDGQIGANGATFSVDSGNAIIAQAVSCRGWFMRNADMTGTLYMHSVDLVGGLFLEGLTARGCRVSHEAIDLTRAKVDGVIDFTDCVMFKGQMVLDHASATGAVTLCRLDPIDGLPRRVVLSARHFSASRFVFPETGMGGVVDLRDAHFGTFDDHHQSWPRSVDKMFTMPNEDWPDRDANRFLLDGLTYDRFENPDGNFEDDNRRLAAKARIRWLLSQPKEDIFEHFKPQPWHQAAKVLRESGYIDDAREVEIEARNRYGRSKSTRLQDKIFSLMAFKLSNYAQNPVRSLRWSLGVIIFFTFVFAHAASYQTTWNPTILNYTSKTEVFSPIYSGTALDGTYPVFGSFYYSLDVFVPILDLGMDEFWRPNTSYWVGGWPVGWMLYSLVIVERMIGAILVALTIFGVTNLLHVAGSGRFSARTN